jgi:hypothetical protein
LHVIWVVASAKNCYFKCKIEKTHPYSIFQIFQRREREVIGTLAALPDNVFLKWQDVMAQAEQGQMKGQRISAKERTTGVVDIAVCKFTKAIKLSPGTLELLFDKLLINEIDFKGFVKEAEEVLKLTVSKTNPSLSNKNTS